MCCGVRTGSARFGAQGRHHHSEDTPFAPPRLDAATAARYPVRMNLEDHLGDVIRKARISAGASVEAVAQVAGLSLGELDQLEASGQSPTAPNYSAVASLLALDGDKLAALAKGWQPQPVDLERWRHLRTITTTESMAVNCHLIWDESTKEAALFDTGWFGRPVFELVGEHRLQLRHLFITHTHTDHVAALAEIRRQYPQVLLHSNARGAPVAQRNRPGETVALGVLRIANRATPGHAEDGATYVITGFPDHAPAVAVVGDAIFAGSIGGARELAGLAKQKIREHIFSLPPETLICPGHGPLTTVGEELAHNPFFVAEKAVDRCSGHC